MSKKYYWEIPEAIIDEETGEPTENVTIHKVELICSNFSGKAIVTINGTKFNISEKPFSLSGSEQMFRLGDMPALLSFPKKSSPTITVDGEIVYPK